MKTLEDGRIIDEAWGVLSDSGTVVSVSFSKGMADMKAALRGIGTKVIQLKVLYRLPEGFKIKAAAPQHVVDVAEAFGGAVETRE